MSVPPYGEEPPPGHYEPYGAPPGFPAAYGGLYQPAPPNGLAIASMVVSIVGGAGVFLLCGVGGLVGVVGAILGHVARARIRRGQASGDGYALAGVIVGWVAFALGVLAVIGWVVLIAVGLSDDSSGPYDGSTSV